MDVALLAEMNGAQPHKNEDRIFSILFQEDDVTWQTIIYALIKTQQMDPWDVNLNTMADMFLELLSKMKKMDFRIGGKMVLAAALLLKMKSEKLMKEDIVALDQLINSTEEEVDLLDELEEATNERSRGPPLVPRTPQPRQRKVSVYDLVEALENALESETKKQFKTQKSEAPTIKAPPKSTDMTVVINALYKNIKKKFSFSKIITFDELVPSPTREDKVYTFIPLLHLDTQRRIDMQQKEHFGTINIKVNKHKFAEEA